MKANLVFDWPFEDYGAKNAYLNHKKGLIMNKVDIIEDKLFDEDVDINHVESVLHKSLLLNLTRSKPLICSCNYAEYEARNTYFGEQARQLWVSLAKDSDAIIVPSLFGKELLISEGIDKPTAVISSGIELNKFKTSAEKRIKFREKFGIRDNKIVVVCLGHVYGIRGVYTFLKIAKQLKNIKFVWCGRTFPHVKDIINIEKIKKPDNVVFTGFVKDKLDAFSAADIYLTPTTFELQGIPVIEAMASKIPIIVRDLPVFRHLRDGRECIKALSVDDFVKAVNRIKSDEKLRNRLIKNAYESVKKHDLNSVGKRLKKVYEYTINSEFDEVSSINEY